jgi:hypothetical protein
MWSTRYFGLKNESMLDCLPFFALVFAFALLLLLPLS